jgi:PPOX class probable F420-dependent enzyme
MSITPSVRAFVEQQSVGVLATSGPDGRVRQSVVYFALQGDELLISTLADRQKARDVERTGWASLCLHGEAPPFPSATLAGPASIRRKEIGPGTAAVMGRIMGAQEPPEPQSDEALAGVGRVLLVIDVDRVGPTLYID